MREIFRTSGVWVIISLLTMMISSCRDNSTEAVIHRLDRTITNGVMPGDSLSLQAAERLFEMSGYGPLTPASLAEYHMRRSISTHAEGVERVFTDTKAEEKALGKVLTRLNEELPGIDTPEIFTVISPFSQSILLSEGFLYIGLNHYLGEDYVYYDYFPQYQRRLKTRERIPVDVAEALIRTAYPYAPTDNYPRTVNRIAYEGAVVEAVMRVTGLDEKTVLGYDDSDYDWLVDNERNIWNTMLERQLLFSSDHNVIRSLVEPSPHSSQISPEAPGRAGRFTGHRLVQSYLKSHPSVKLEELLSPSFYESPTLLQGAQY